MDKTQMIAHGVTAVAILALGVYAQKQISTLNEKIKQLETMIGKMEPSTGAPSDVVDDLGKNFKKSHEWSVNNFKSIQTTFSQQNTEISKLRTEMTEVKQTLGQIMASLRSLGEHQTSTQQELQMLRSRPDTRVYSSPQAPQAPQAQHTLPVQLAPQTQQVPVTTSSPIHQSPTSQSLTPQVTFNLQDDEAFADLAADVAPVGQEVRITSSAPKSARKHTASKSS